MSHVKADIVIVGAGLVGASLAIALKDSGLSCIVLEKNALGDTANESRPLSLTANSVKQFQAWGLWPDLHASAMPLQTVEVTEAKRFGATVFQASDHELSALGYVLPFARVQSVLQNTLSQLRHVRVIDQVSDMQCRVAHDAGVVVQCAHPSGVLSIEARVIVGADGVHSQVRNQCGFKATQEDPEITAVIARVAVSQWDVAQACQRFTPKGILALLPSLEGPAFAHCVWSMPNAVAETLESDAVLYETLKTYWPRRWGQCESVRRLMAYPLQWKTVATPVKPGCVLIGSAAHHVYPLAAQGFNLSLEDVNVLANALSTLDRHASMNERQQTFPVLTRYWDQRRAQRERRHRVIQGVHRVFSMPFPGLSVVRAAGLGILDLCPGVQRQLFPLSEECL